MGCFFLISKVTFWFFGNQFWAASCQNRPILTHFGLRGMEFSVGQTRSGRWTRQGVPKVDFDHQSTLRISGQVWILSPSEEFSEVATGGKSKVVVIPKIFGGLLSKFDDLDFWQNRASSASFEDRFGLTGCELRNSIQNRQFCDFSQFRDFGPVALKILRPGHLVGFMVGPRLFS